MQSPHERLFVRLGGSITLRTTQEGCHHGPISDTLYQCSHEKSKTARLGGNHDHNRQIFPHVRSTSAAEFDCIKQPSHHAGYGVSFKLSRRSKTIPDEPGTELQRPSLPSDPALTLTEEACRKRRRATLAYSKYPQATNAFPETYMRQAQIPSSRYAFHKYK